MFISDLPRSMFFGLLTHQKLAGDCPKYEFPDKKNHPSGGYWLLCLRLYIPYYSYRRLLASLPPYANDFSLDLFLAPQCISYRGSFDISRSGKTSAFGDGLQLSCQLIFVLPYQ